jgi:hypothetical protein
MKKILALCATPRSTSTAFEWVMKNRGDLNCFHEPYNKAFYYGEDRRNNRYYIADSSLKTPTGLSIASTHEDMISHADEGAVFIKDFAYSIMHRADDTFLDAFNHTFLIRDPEKVITSMHARWPDITLAEIGFEDLHALFKRIADREGKAPIVIDSDELMLDPDTGISTYCDLVGIPFIADAMTWSDNQKQIKNPTWNTDEHGFHDSLKSSSGLKPQKRDYPPLKSSDDMMRMYEASLPHYEALYSMRTRIDARTELQA